MHAAASHMLSSCFPSFNCELQHFNMLPTLHMQDAGRLPSNAAIDGIPDAIASAAAAVARNNGFASPQDSGGVVVMVVQPGERNAYDQQVRHIY